MSSKTPRRITSEVRLFCDEIVAGGEPVFLDVSISPNAVPLDCFMNIQQHVAEAGGGIQYGWRIWEWPYILIQAEFHSVWSSPDGDLVDLTPSPGSVSPVLFLPDPSRVYENRQVD